MSEWKPGDVAIRRSITGEEQLSIVSESCAFKMHDREPHWHHADNGWDQLEPGRSTYRRVVVIDAEDAEQVERLIADYVDTYAERNRGRGAGAWGESHVEAMQAALREFARPTPPRCVAHGVIECDSCARISAEYLRDGQCTDCGSWGETGMHSDTCRGRIRGAVYANRDEARGVRS